jgi:dephospho-CoA kinase
MTLRLGLTGGIGSGKSTVAAMLVDLGAHLLDADAASRALTAPHGDAMPAIKQVFGPAFVAPDGGLDRQRMREWVFSDPSAKARLEALLHPLVGQALWQQAEAAQAAGASCLLFDVPLLVESAHWRSRMDRICVVDCSADTQISRVVARNQMTAQEVQAIIASQASRRQRLACADLVIYNDGLDLHDLRSLVASLAQTLGLSSAAKAAMDSDA